MSQEESIAVNYRPLLLIFGSILATKLLHSITSPTCSWVVRRMTWLPSNFDRIKSDITALKKEVDTVSITGDFPTHARLKRKQTVKETELSKVEGEYRSTVYKRQAVLEALTFIILECITLGVVLYYRSVPVITMPTECLWPVGNILQFPTGVAGSVGSPVWALCSRQTLQMITALFKK